MIVTAIIAILAMIASVPIRRVRERAFVSAAKQEVKNALRGAISYQTVYEQFPENIADMSDYYVPGGSMQFCVFAVTEGASPSQDVLQIDGIHKGAETGVTTTYPTNGGILTEKKMPNCVPVSTTTPSAKKGKKRGR